MAPPREWANGTSDQDVIARVRAGESALYETLIHRYDRTIRYLTLRVLHDEADAEDIVQDAHLKAFVNLSQFEGRSSYATWLGTIAIRSALAHARRLARSGALTTLDPAEVAGPAQDPEQRVLQNEARHELRSGVAALPLKYRSIVILRAIRELSTAETARALSISEQTVKTRLYRAKALLRAYFKRETVRRSS